MDLIKEKTLIVKVFDDEILIPGVKVLAKYRCMYDKIEDDSWEEEINGEVIKCYENILYIKDLENGDYSLWEDGKYYPDQYSIRVENIEDGFWKVELV